MCLKCFILRAIYRENIHLNARLLVFKSTILLLNFFFYLSSSFLSRPYRGLL